MGRPPITEEEKKRRLNAVVACHGDTKAAAKELGLSVRVVQWFVRTHCGGFNKGRDRQTPKKEAEVMRRMEAGEDIKQTAAACKISVRCVLAIMKKHAAQQPDAETVAKRRKQMDELCCKVDEAIKAAIRDQSYRNMAQVAKKYGCTLAHFGWLCAKCGRKCRYQELKKIFKKRRKG